jgi:hypothetical protein
MNNVFAVQIAAYDLRYILGDFCIGSKAPEHRKQIRCKKINGRPVAIRSLRYAVSDRSHYGEPGTLYGHAGEPLLCGTSLSVDVVADNP